jgi:D-arginine dehydrogenase
MTSTTDVLIIGGGIAGAGAAFEISRFAAVVLLEREPQFGFHSTGRSAASFTENYGNGLIRRLVIASRQFLENPPADFCEYPLLSPRGLITIARADQLELYQRQLAMARALVPSITSMTAAEVLARVPILCPEHVAAAIWEPNSREIDVSGLHQGFLRAAKSRGARLVVAAGAEAITRRGEWWQVETPAGTFAAPVLVNAAGAWADVVAAQAGIAPLGLVPKRRTAFNLPAPPGMDVRAWPMVDAIGGDLYFKPDAGQLLVSPADATPSDPVDAQADDIDVAIGVERFERVTTVNVTRVTRTWAGLRTYADDGSPVVGFEPSTPGFLWLAGQGGFGIKTSPALSRACAALLQHRPLPDDLTRLGIAAAELSPERLRDSRPDSPRLVSPTTVES